MADKFIPEEIEALISGEHGAPFNVLGIQREGADEQVLVCRAFQPHAERVEYIDGASGNAVEMPCADQRGIFECRLEQEPRAGYRYRIHYREGNRAELDDPYRFPAQLTEFDIYLHAEGTHYRTYEKMGAHIADIDGVKGVHFAVWAPNAVRVSVIGAFNRWDGRTHPMQKHPHGGLWELFIPGMREGDLYKFEIKGPNDYLSFKSDPYAFYTEVRPKSASVVRDVTAYEWTDDAWMRRRRSAKWHEKPISVYEVHLGSWKRNGRGESDWLTYRELADQLVDYVREMGYTHIELLPISEHPFDGSWGYQTIGYYAPTSRFGTPDDFKYFVDRMHAAGIGVLIDWVPAHFPKDAHGLASFDGTHLYEHADPRKGEHMDWGTLIFNYGRNEVRAFLLSNALFWADLYHIDGLRVDAVASMLYLDYSRGDSEWIPNEYGGRENLEAISFLKTFNEIIHGEYPGFLTFAEESTSWPMVSRPTYIGGLGFDFKWNMGWMHDTLEYITKDPVHRKYHHGELTFSMLYAFTENFILPFSHDEVVHGKRAMLDKMPGDLWQKVANLRLLYAYMFTHPGKKLLFMGSDFGQWREWNNAESLDWHLLDEEPYHGQIRDLVRELNRLYREMPALHEIDCSWEGFEWIDCHDSDQSTLSYQRRGNEPSDFLVIAANFTPVPRTAYRLGVPYEGIYREILNTDAGNFGGSGIMNRDELQTEAHPWQSHNFSLLITIPPLAAIVLQPEQVIIPEPAEAQTIPVEDADAPLSTKGTIESDGDG